MMVKNMDQFWHLYYRVFDPARRMGRGAFNLIMFLAFIPVSAIQIYGVISFGQKIATNMMNPTFLQSLQDQPAAPAFDWSDALYLLTMFALAPVFVARLRDVRWSPHWTWVIYAPIFFTLNKALLNIIWPSLITMPMSLFGGILVLRLCSLPSKEIEKTAPVTPPPPFSPPPST